MPTPSWTVSFTTPTASNSPAKACAGHEANRTRRLDQTSSPVTQIHRPARLATRAASFRYGGRHHSGIPGDIIPLYPGDFVGIRKRAARKKFDVLADAAYLLYVARRQRSRSLVSDRDRHKPPNKIWPVSKRESRFRHPCRFENLGFHNFAGRTSFAIETATHFA